MCGVYTEAASHSGSTWRNKVTYFMARKQRRKRKEQYAIIPFKGRTPVTSH
jgi:hypothetical protein